MLLSSSGSNGSTRRVVGYRFAGVLFDAQRARLVVDGEDVAVGALPLKLLRAVCEANGALVSRQDLFELIWPRQTISDEALTKLIQRTREMLGVHGGALITVRGQGLRLDAKIEPQFELEHSIEPHGPKPDSAQIIDAPGMSAPAPPQRSQARWIAVLAAAIICAALGWWPASDRVLSPGYALRVSDLQASKADTADLVGAAFKAEANGEIVHARTMMRSAHDSDSTSPVPAMMLAWWDAAASTDASARWVAAARQRLRADSTPYVRLMVDYFEARGKGAPVRGPINAMLDLRPQAWHLQYARTHDQLGNHEFAGALVSLQQIPLDIPDPGQVADILTERVALGDTIAAELVTSAIRRDPVLDAFVRGRFAYSRADLGTSIAAFDQCRDVAESRRDYLRARDADLYAAMAATEKGGADATARVDHALRLCREQNVQSCEAEMLGLRAFLEVRAGHAEDASATLANAWQINRTDFLQPPLLLIALENGLPPPGDVAVAARSVPADTVFGGVAEIMLAWQAFAAGDKDRARSLLDRAREHGIAHTYHAEDAALLDLRLGGPTTACRVDPPYPNLLRLSACVAMRSMPNHN
jgi:DNA-binding winged helix-turn-helix (wHTH) protein